MRIEVENLYFSYAGKREKNKKYAVDGVSLTIEEGDFFGIIGQTGSGKSTFVQHLNGLLKPSDGRGRIKIGEYDLGDKKTDYKALRSKVGMVFQYPEHQLFAETVKEDVSFGVKNFYPEKSESEIESIVKTAIETVGLDYEKIAEKSPFELSGGQKRRVAIAGVIAPRPEVLVLDEPAAGLDPEGKADFLNLLKKLHADFVKTIIIVSHDMDLVAEYCNKVAVFKGGKIVKSGTPKEVFSDEKAIYGCGLDLPVTEYLIKRLKERGIQVESGTTVAEFVSAVKEKFGGER